MQQGFAPYIYVFFLLFLFFVSKSQLQTEEQKPEITAGLP